MFPTAAGMNAQGAYADFQMRDQAGEGELGDDTKYRRSSLTSKLIPSSVRRWFRARSGKQVAGLTVLAAVTTLVVLGRMLNSYDDLFIFAEAVHFIGIGVLVYKLKEEKTCAGISFKSQLLTAIFLAIRFCCSLMMEYDIHTLLDLVTLAATVWVMYTMKTNLRATYNAELDDLKTLYVVGPCLVLACLAHPDISAYYLLQRIAWAFCVYMEAVSVLPQLQLMRKDQVVERFTAHYVFALAVARFFNCAHWLLQFMDPNSTLVQLLGGGGLWPPMVLLAEIVQTFILSDFCYFYLKSAYEGSNVVRLPI